MRNITESTRRTLRTVLQGVGAFAAFLVAVAIPPVGDAINAVLGAIPGVDVRITPGLVVAIGVVGTALTAVVTKIQNLVEGRDQIDSPESLAVEVIELMDLVDELIDAGEGAGVEVKDILAKHGYARLPL